MYWERAKTLLGKISRGIRVAQLRERAQEPDLKIRYGTGEG